MSLNDAIRELNCGKTILEEQQKMGNKIDFSKFHLPLQRCVKYCLQHMLDKQGTKYEDDGSLFIISTYMTMVNRRWFVFNDYKENRLLGDDIYKPTKEDIIEAINICEKFIDLCNKYYA